MVAKLVIVEFQLRRAKESKISKLWLKTTMKKKREACYEKEEADMQIQRKQQMVRRL